MTSEGSTSARAPVEVGLSAVIVAVTDEVPRVLTVQRSEIDQGLGRPDHGERTALPFGPLDPAADRTLALALRRWVTDLTGLDLDYVEQLYTFGDRDRDPAGGARRLSVAYLALVRQEATSSRATTRWRDIYELLPWEDWRGGRPPVLDDLTTALGDWIDRGADEPTRRTPRRRRAKVAFGLRDSPWDVERVLERYELLYEAGLVQEAVRDGAVADDIEPAASTEDALDLGASMALDHRRIIAVALARLRGKLKYRPLVFELTDETFTLLQLQRVVEALAGVRLHKQNFRRLVDREGLVEGTGDLDTSGVGRPAELFRFRPEVLSERRAPGIGLPVTRDP